jgi:hypothetical protein
MAEERLQASYDVLCDSGDDYESAKTQLYLARLHAGQDRQKAAASALALCVPVLKRLDATIDLQQALAMQEQLVQLSY